MDECDYDFSKVGNNIKVENNKDVDIKTKQNENDGNCYNDIKIKQEVKSEKCNDVDCSNIQTTDNNNDNDGNYCKNIKIEQEIKSENCKDTDYSDDMQTTGSNKNNIAIKNETSSEKYNTSDCSDDDKNNITDEDTDDDDVYKRHSINIMGYDFMLSDGSKFDIYDTIRKTDFSFTTKKKKSDDFNGENLDCFNRLAIVKYEYGVFKMSM